MIKYEFLRFPGDKKKAVTLSYDDGHSVDLKFADIISKTDSTLAQLLKQ